MAVNPYTWLVSTKVVKYGRGERNSTQDNMISAGREPTQYSSFGERHESTQDNALNGAHESTQSNAFCVGHESTQPNPWYRRGGRVQPAGP